MEGQKAALGLFLVLTVGSGCAGLTGNTRADSSFSNLDLSVDEVEKATGAEYSAINQTDNPELLKLSTTVRQIGSVFNREDNISEAPETVQSMVVALNGSESESLEGINSSTVQIDGFTAERLDEGNSTILYGRRGNVSFIVEAEGRDGIYSSAKELYISMATRVQDFTGS